MEAAPVFQGRGLAQPEPRGSCGHLLCGLWDLDERVVLPGEDRPQGQGCAFTLREEKWGPCEGPGVPVSGGTP